MAAVSLLLLSGCKSTREAVVRTEYRTVWQHDSVYVDCTDTLYVVQKGDTVTIREKVVDRRYFFRILADTTRKADTVTVTERVMVRDTDCPKLRRWPWFAAGMGTAVGLILILRILIAYFFKK